MLIHVVQSGDTVSGIARLYGVSAARILSDNGLNANSRLVVGQALIITLPETIYTVRSGDSLYSIAAQFGVSVLTLIQNNPELALNTEIYPGRQLTISFRGEKIRTINIMGYAYPHINRSTLNLALPYITYLSIFSYGFTEDGELIPINDTELINAAYRFNAAPVMVFSSITENGGFSSERASRMLNDEAFQNRVIDNTISTMLEKGYLGLDVDFEYIPPRDAEAYIAFLSNVRRRLSEFGLLLNVDLAPKTYATQPGLLYEAHDYPAIGAIADSVFLMTYEWGYTYGPPMAVAPLPQVRDVVSYGASVIDRNKIYMGIPNYGYDWTLPYEQGVSRAANVGNEQAVRIAAANNARIEFDSSAQSPYFEYYSAGRSHIVWFEDVRSIQAKLLLADEFGLRGVGYWNLMRPFRQNWALIASRWNVGKVI